MESRGQLEREAASLGERRRPIVALGAEEGGTRALQQFLAQVPADCGMAFIVILRQPAGDEADLVALLQRQSALPLTRVVEPTPVASNHVYLVPPDRTVVMADGTINLVERARAEDGAAPIDLLFRTLAEAHGMDAAAVVLSGNGGDGAMGLLRIKEMGGLTVAQDPADADVSEMPRRAVATGMVDVVLPAAELPAKLLDYWRRAETIQLPAAEPPDLAEEDILGEIFALLRTRTGHDFSQYKRSTILRRLGRRMVVTHADSPAAYLALLRGSLEETRALLGDFLISVTNFFRDRDAWAALDAVVPRLFAGKSADDQVRVWVTGCATGEEAYSVAILLHEHAARLDAPPSIQVFATDIDEAAIATARQGVYAETIAVDVQPTRLRRYFVAEPGHYRVKQEIRDLVLFAAHNILRDPPFSRLDLVTCRNVLIYLNRGVQEQILRLFHFSLLPDSLLLLGSSESTDGVPDLFAPIDREHRLFQRRMVLNTAPFLIANLTDGRARRAQLATIARDADEPRPSFAAVHERLLLDHVPPSILVTADHEIVHVADGAGQYLAIGAGEPSYNLMDVALPELRLELRFALFAAGQNGGRTVTRRLHLARDDNGRQLIELLVRPVEEPAWARGYFLLVFREMAEIEEIVRRPGDDVEPMVRQIEDDLQRTKDQLQVTVEQYEAAVEEYRAANEELQAINEEGRATGEELETSKEELQSANEELTTLNQALKHSLEEAKQTSNDLRNLMAATEIGTIFLDSDLRIKLYTPSALELFNVIPADVNRPLVHITHRLIYHELMEDAQQVRDTRERIQREVCSEAGRWYQVDLLPYWAADEIVTGVVLTLVDITDRKEVGAERERVYAIERDARAQAEEAVRVRDQFLSIASHELRTPLTTVQGYAAMLERRSRHGTDTSERTTRVVTMIVRQTERLNMLIEQLLDASRLQRGQFELTRHPLALDELVKRAVDDYRMGLPTEAEHCPLHTIELSREPGPVPVLGDANRLEQVFQNLLTNAVKYSPEGGAIEVRLQHDAGEATIEVRDYGIGIPAEVQPRLFEPFYRVETENRGDIGFGIGLYVVHEIVTRHGGRVEVTSSEGAGSLFRVVLPLLDAAE